METTELDSITRFSGSRIRFKNEETGQFIDIHRPHPGSIMKHWMMKAIYQHLLDRGLLK